MFRCFLAGSGVFSFIFRHQRGFNYQQKCSLVNIKLKWAKDKTLDGTVAGRINVRAVCILVAIIASDPQSCLPIYHINCQRRHLALGLPSNLKLSTFMRRYPTIFHEVYFDYSGGSSVPCYRLTPEALSLHQEELKIFQQNYTDLLNRLCKLLMLTKDRTLPSQTIDQLKWDLGLPFNYDHLLFQRHPELFSYVRLPDDHVGLKLVRWDEHLAVSELEKNASIQQMEEDVKAGTLAFPVRFTRGFGLKKKCMNWLKEWQKLPYTSPYCDASHLDRRTDVSEKRNVGVFHELLYLTIHRRTDRKNVSNLRGPLALPQKFTKVFERHPAIFYISRKCDTQTVILREAYDGDQLVQKHPLVEIRDRYASLMWTGVLNRSRGLYKKKKGRCCFRGGSIE